jgi:hypothetical protein
VRANEVGKGEEKEEEGEGQSRRFMVADGDPLTSFSKGRGGPINVHL